VHHRVLRETSLGLFCFLTCLALTFAGVEAFGYYDVGGRLEQSAREGWRQLLLLAMGPPRVGIQIGHEGVEGHPDELAALRGNTGGYAQGVSEVEVNRAVAEVLRDLLEAHGVRVDLLRATPPQAYRADLLLSLHADSVPDPTRQGYKSAHFEPPRSYLEPRLKNLIDAAYYAASGLPDDHHNTTLNMIEYYAFNHRAYRHTVHPSTPALIVELGYISSPSDLAFLLEPERPARALAEGALAFLRARGRLPETN